MSAPVNRTCHAARVLLVGLVATELLLWASDAVSGAEIVLKSLESAQQDSAYGLTNEDYWRISQVLVGLQHLVPIREVPSTARRGVREQEIRLVGTTADLAEVDKLGIKQGRFLTSRDDQDRNNVAVLGSTVARRLFAMDNPIGRNVRVGKHYFAVVGVLERPAPSVPSRDKNIYIPLTTMQSRYGDSLVRTKAGMFEQQYYELSAIRIVPQDPDKLEPMMRLVRSLLEETHERRDYSVRRAGKPTRPSPGERDGQGADVEP